jgi:predicted nucleotidyltransferase
MATLAQATLSAVERRVLERVVRSLEEELGPQLRAVWLYGSRARGEPPHEESDIDLLVVSDRAHADDGLRVIQLVDAAAEAEGGRPAAFSTLVYTPERVEQRREIRSFFMLEVDRDKIVLYGEP